MPDPERCVYLQFAARALEDIGQGIDANKALGIWTNSPRHRVSPNRESTIILSVGLELEKLRRTSQLSSPVRQAIRNVAGRLKVGTSVVEKTWRRAGGEDAWNAARSDETAK